METGNANELQWRCDETNRGIVVLYAARHGGTRGASDAHFRLRLRACR
jgi:hypothetical protein